jgi:type II secretory pathway pseudopilin PulG
MYKRHTLIKYARGMTLVELLVVVAIFMMVTGIVIFNYANFRSSISTQNLADAISLSVRKAQSNAIGARATGDDFTYGYGVHFTTRKVNTDAIRGVYLGGSNKSFILFTDIGTGGTGDRMYTYAPDDRSACGSKIDAGSECTEMLTITTLDEISAIYLNDEINPIRDDAFVDVTFLRPNPDAYFCYKSNSNPTPPCERSNDISHVRIEVSNAQNSNQINAIRTITIWNTGQISTSTGTRRAKKQDTGDFIDIGPGTGKEEEVIKNNLIPTKVDGIENGIQSETTAEQDL